jgi:hypothetical protein
VPKRSRPPTRVRRNGMACRPERPKTNSVSVLLVASDLLRSRLTRL